MSAYANHLINERLGTNREGIRDAYRGDAQTKVMVNMLRRFCGSVEDAARVLDLDQETTEKLLQIVVTGSMPSMPDVIERKEIEESLQEHLRTHMCTGPESVFHPESQHPLARRGLFRG